MTTTAIANVMSRSLHRGAFILRKHAPEILAFVGTIGTIASGVLACKATTKVGAILEETKETLDVIHEGMEKGEIRGREYTEEDGKKDLMIVYAQTGLKFVKLYGPSVALGLLSIGSLLTSNNILRKRNVALAAAYTAIENSFKKYRGRVAERFGKQVDRELLYNVKAKQIETTVKDEETGEEKTVETTVTTVDPADICSPYSVIFDELNPYYDKTRDYNLMFLRARQSWVNDLLRTRHHLFLNEVLDELGFPRTPEGQIVGWIYDPKNPDHDGDNYIDFGLNDAENIDFVNGDERSVILDFNVDGNIWKKMKTKEHGDKFSEPAK